LLDQMGHTLHTTTKQHNRRSKPSHDLKTVAMWNPEDVYIQNMIQNSSDHPASDYSSQDYSSSSRDDYQSDYTGYSSSNDYQSDYHGYNSIDDYQSDYHGYNSSDDYQSDYPGFIYSGSSSSSLGNTKFNFSGLSVSSLKLTPQTWDPLEHFQETVTLKLYMFIPTIVGGVLLGLLLWALLLIMIHSASHLKKTLLPNKTDVTLEERGQDRIENKSRSRQVSYTVEVASQFDGKVNVEGYPREILQPPSPQSSSSSRHVYIVHCTVL